jgi:hypothetical protein
VLPNIELNNNFGSNSDLKKPLGLIHKAAAADDEIT